MKYQEFSLFTFDTQFKTERSIIEFLWDWKLDQNDFKCSCKYKSFYRLSSRPEVRECKRCGKQHRLRSGTIFENSKVSLRHWLYALLLMMSGKRGISALELQKHLGIGSYKTAWGMLHKIRTALIDRDSKYQLHGMIEVDGAQFGKKSTNNGQEVIIGIESKSLVDDKGEVKENAGFAQVLVGQENKDNAKKFIDGKISNGSELLVDGAKAYELDECKVKMNSVPTFGDKSLLKAWQPWVFKFISNAKVWLLGTHHGIKKKYLANYLGEYTYRFNRRHDSKRLFSRSLRACMEARPISLVKICTPLPALTG